MINVIRPLSAALLLLCAGFSASALAHNPMCECKAIDACLLYTSPSPRDRTRSRMPSSA